MRKGLSAVVVAALGAAALVVAIAGPAPGGASAPVTVTKVVTGPEAPGATYTVNVSCIGTGPFTGNNPSANLNFAAGGGSQQFGGIDPGYEGDCTFTETSTGGAVHIAYACAVAPAQSGAATCGGGGAAPSTLNVNDPSAAQLATITVTNDFTPDPAVAVVAPANFTG
jgi:Domain of unknown function (DUF5979)